MHLNGYKYEGSVISLSENREYFKNDVALMNAINLGIILEGMVISCDENHRLCVDLGTYQGFIDKNEVQYSPCEIDTRDIAVITRVGKAVCFKIKDFVIENGKKSLILSRKDAQMECHVNFLMSLNNGDIIDAKVTHLEPFGAFVDIGCGVISLLSIDCISVSRISHPKDRLYVGQKIKVIIKSIDYNSGRIYVSLKELLGTWEENVAAFNVGQTVAGIVRSVESYGIFVELTPNLAGLAEFRNDISVGQTTAVYIKNIIPQRMKLKLVIIDSYKGENKPNREVYTFPESVRHMDKWRYSPINCDKVIQTDFT